MIIWPVTRNMEGLQCPTWDACIYLLKILASINYYLICITSLSFIRIQFNTWPLLYFGLRYCNGYDVSLGTAGTAQYPVRVAILYR